MKIGLISAHSFIQPGGVKRHILGLYKEFKRRGVEIKIIIPRRELREYYGKDVILLGTSFPINFSGSQSDFDIHFNPLSIEDTLREEKFDILHFHNVGFPSILQILTSPAIENTLNILTFHANIAGSKFLTNFPSLIYVFNKICQWKIDGIIGVAPLSLKVFKDYKGPKTIIPNGVDSEEFNPKVPKLKKFSDGKINILFVGRIQERKGLIYLLRAYKILERKFSNLRLIIVGDGELKEECKNYVKKNKLKEVYFEGEITGKKLPTYYTSCDIFCSPAIFGESFGIVILEAMASGKPVVAFANEGYKELLSGKKGEKFLAKAKDYRRLAEKLEVLIKSPQLRKEMSRWGIEEAKRYSWLKVANRVLNFYSVCKRTKAKLKRKQNFSLEDIIIKLEKVLNQDILEWLRKEIK